jgi:Ca-activated chloride channel family protein
MTYTPINFRREFPEHWKLSELERSFGALETAQGMLPLTDLGLNGIVRGLDYSVSLTQVFKNPYAQPLEATYIFPLPARAAVSAFVMTTSQRRVVGELQERGQARANYDRAISQGKQAAIAEEERPETFTMRVGNIPAGESVTIELTLQGPLSCVDESAIFRFPLVVAPKYIPGVVLDGENVGDGTAQDTDRVPDASRISPPVLLPGYPNPVRLSIEFELESDLFQVDELESTLELFLDDRNKTKLVYLPQPGGINHDFVLRFPFGKDKLRSNLEIQPLEEGKSVFCMTFVPPAGLTAKVHPKQVVVLLDRSGSMEGWKMGAARRTCARIIDSFKPEDKFSLIAFDDSCDEIRPAGYPNGLIQASDRNRYQYGLALQSVEARGGTEILAALQTAIAALSGNGQAAAEPDGKLRGVRAFNPSQDDPNIEKHIILVTDGQVGNEREVVRYLAKNAAPKNIKVSTVGIDQAVNAVFLEDMAKATNGLAQVVLSEEELDRSMTSLCRRIGSPVLSGIQLVGANASELVFQHNDVYPGIATRIYGVLKGAVPASLEISATQADGKPFQADLKPVAVGQRLGALRSLWGRERLLQFEHELNVGKSGALSAAQITEFSLKYGVLCRYTAFLAVDHERELPKDSGEMIQVVQAVETPAGWAEQVVGRRSSSMFGSVSKKMVSQAAPVCAPEPEFQEELCEPEYEIAPCASMEVLRDEFADFEPEPECVPMMEACSAPMECLDDDAGYSNVDCEAAPKACPAPAPAMPKMEVADRSQKDSPSAQSSLSFDLRQESSDKERRKEEAPKKAKRQQAAPPESVDWDQVRELLKRVVEWLAKAASLESDLDELTELVAQLKPSLEVAIGIEEDRLSHILSIPEIGALKSELQSWIDDVEKRLETVAPKAADSTGDRKQSFWT